MNALNRAYALTLFGIFVVLGLRGCGSRSGLALLEDVPDADATLTPPPDAPLTDAHDANEGSPLVDAFIDTPTVDAPLDAPTPVCDWSRMFGANAELFGFAVDTNGNVFIGGRFRDSIDFGSGPILADVEADGFLAMLDSSGKTLWSHITSGVAYDSVTDAAFDSAGNVLALITSTIALGGGGIGPTSTLVKYDLSGSLLWTRDIGPLYFVKFAVTSDDSIIVVHPSTTVPFAIAWTALDPTGTQVLWQKAVPGVIGLSDNSAHPVAAGAERVVFIGGYGNTFGGPPDFGGGPLPSNPEGSFVAAFTTEGTHVFSKAIGLPKMLADSVSVAPNGDVYVAGRNGSSSHASLVRLDKNGTPLYAHEFDAIVFDFIDVDARSGGVTLIAAAKGDYDFGGGKVPPLAPEQYECTLTQFDATPTFQNTRQFGGDATGPAPPHVVVREDIYVGGTSGGSMDFGQGPLVPPGPSAVYVAKCPL